MFSMVLVVIERAYGFGDGWQHISEAEIFVESI